MNRIVTLQRASILASALAGGCLARVAVGAPPWMITLAAAFAIGGALSRTAATPSVAPPAPIEPPVADEWWVAGARQARPSCAEPRTGRAANRPLESYLVRTRAGRLPQCPSCAAFDIAVPGPGRSRFVCRSCGHQWRWSAGDPWPAVTLQPFSRTSAHQ